MFRIRFKDGFRIASFGPEFVLNNGNRLFLASGAPRGCRWKGGCPAVAEHGRGPHAGDAGRGIPQRRVHPGPPIFAGPAACLTAGCLTSLVGLVLCLAMQDATLAEEAGPGPGAGYTAVLPAPGCDEEGGAAPDPGTPAKLHTRPAPGLSAKLAEFVKSCRVRGVRNGGASGLREVGGGGVWTFGGAPFPASPAACLIPLPADSFPQSVALSREFVKYIAMCIITVNLKAAFRYLDTMLPKYQLRCGGKWAREVGQQLGVGRARRLPGLPLGTLLNHSPSLADRRRLDRDRRAFGCGAPIGMIYAINPATIILLVPVVGALTTAYTHFDMIHFGSYLSALSPLWLVVWPRKAGAALFVLTLSLGEAVWSPRWYDYSMAVAPDGKEGVFTALASAPLFAAMLPTGEGGLGLDVLGWVDMPGVVGGACVVAGVGAHRGQGPEPPARCTAPCPGMLSGYLLERYCPGSGTCDHTKEAEGLATGGSGLRALVRGFASPAAPGPDAATCRGGTMWSIVSALTLTSPILILLTQVRAWCGWMGWWVGSWGGTPKVPGKGRP